MLRSNPRRHGLVVALFSVLLSSALHAAEGIEDTVLATADFGTESRSLNAFETLGRNPAVSQVAAAGFPEQFTLGQSQSGLFRASRVYGVEKRADPVGATPRPILGNPAVRPSGKRQSAEPLPPPLSAELRRLVRARNAFNGSRIWDGTTGDLMTREAQVFRVPKHWESRTREFHRIRGTWSPVNIADNLSKKNLGAYELVLRKTADTIRYFEEIGYIHEGPPMPVLTILPSEKDGEKKGWASAHYWGKRIRLIVGSMVKRNLSFATSHEATHILFCLMFSKIKGHEFGRVNLHPRLVPMAEGFADYFANVVTGRVLVGAIGRDIRRLPANISGGDEDHRLGHVFAHCLWILRGRWIASRRGDPKNLDREILASLAELDGWIEPLEFTKVLARRIHATEALDPGRILQPFLGYYCGGRSGPRRRRQYATVVI